MCHPDSIGETAGRADRREIGIPLPGEELPASWFLPAGGHGPAVLVVSDIYGRTPFYEHLSARLADAGYVVALPDLFFRQGELRENTRDAAFARHSRLDESGAVGDLAAVLAWVREAQAVGGSTVGLLGFCLGGTLALDLAAEHDGLAVACYYAFPYGMTSSRPAPRPIDLTDRIHAPVLAFWGDRDYIDLDDIHAFSQRMHVGPSDYEHVIYPGQGHGFLTGLVEDSAATPAATDSWSRVHDFFSGRLGRGAG